MKFQAMNPNQDEAEMHREAEHWASTHRTEAEAAARDMRLFLAFGTVALVAMGIALVTAAVRVFGG